MKKIILFATFFIITVSLNPLRGQGGLDTLRYSQESGTLQKQRFIDQYDYVFMTKEPTKWLLKVGVTSISGTNWSDVGGTGVLGVEYKISPSLSLGFTGGLRSDIGFRNSSVEGELFGRWYYDMSRRIKEGRSANNFSGNYVGVGTTRRYDYNDFILTQPDLNPLSKTSINSIFWGMQRRFFQHGWADFRVSLGQYQYDNSYLGRLGVTYPSINALWLFTSWQVGFAFGDLRPNRAKSQTCDVFKCMEWQRNWLKIRMPYVSASKYKQMIYLGAAFEHRIGNSAFSISLEDRLLLDGRNEHTQFQIINNTVIQTDYQYVVDWRNYVNLELRYYVFKKRQIAAGKSAANLSGIYAGINQGIGFGQSSQFTVNGVLSGNRYQTNYWTAPLVGIQQRVFKNGFIDFKIGVPIKPLSPSEIPQRLTDNATDLKIGFAF